MPSAHKLRSFCQIILLHIGKDGVSILSADILAILSTPLDTKTSTKPGSLNN